MNFREILKQSLIDKGLNQKELASILDCSPATISNWLNGSIEPNRNRQKEVFNALGVRFEEDNSQINKMKKAKPVDVANSMGISIQTLYKGLQQGVFPWGYAIHTSEHEWTYVINAEKFERIEGVQI